jgi:hypothetical protein
MKYIQHTQITSLALGEETTRPHGGDLAINEDGELGVITELLPPPNIYGGVHVYDGSAPKGSRWESRNPRVVGCVDDAKAFVESLKNEQA